MKRPSARILGIPLALLGLTLFLWKLPLQTQDGPNHKKVAIILKRLDSSPFEQSIYQNQLGPLKTNSLFPSLFQFFSRWLSIHSYEKLFLGFFLILLLISYAWLLNEWSPESFPLWVMALPLCFHPLFCQGMYNFLASVPLTLLAIIFLRKGTQSGGVCNWLALTLISWLAFLAHPFSFIILPIVWVILFFQNFPKSWKASIAFGIPIFIFSFFGFILPFFTSTPSSSMGFIFKPPWELLVGMFWFNFPAFSIPQLFFYLPFFIILILLIFSSLKSAAWNEKIFWMVFLLAYFIFPNEEASGGAHINNRFLIYFWLFLPLGIRPAWKGFNLVRYTAILTGIAGAFIVFLGMNEIQREVSQAQSVLKNLPSPSRLYPINFQPHGPALNYSGLLHIWANYEDNKKIFSPYLFVRHQMMPLYRKRPPSSHFFPSTAEDMPEKLQRGDLCQRNGPKKDFLCEKLVEQKYVEMIDKASYYDYWYLYQPPPSFLTHLSSIPDLEKVSEAGNSSLWHYSAAKTFTPPLGFDKENGS